MASVQPVCSVSEGIDKLHRLWSVLYNVAALYVKAKAQGQEDQDMTTVGNDFDMYLTQLGFMPQQSEPQPQIRADREGLSTSDGECHGEVPATDQAARLGDWFMGNRYIMGLMEEDLSDLNSGGWSSIVGGP